MAAAEDRATANRLLAAWLRTRNAGRAERAAAWLFGRRETVAHLGWRFRLARWRRADYLLDLRAPGP